MEPWPRTLRAANIHGETRAPFASANYFYRVKDVIRFLRRQWGNPDKIVKYPPVGGGPLAGKNGLILFEVTGWNDALGHATLWNGMRCHDHCYFNEPGVVFISTLAAATVAGESPGAARRANGANYKDRVLASCLAKAYGDSAAGRDARGAASILTEWTYVDVEKAGSAPDALVDQFLKRDYHNPLEGYEGARFELLKCLDLYHSKQLDDLVRAYVPHPAWFGHRPKLRAALSPADMRVR